MARSPRIDQLGVFQHLMAQGIDRCPIFRDAEDRRWFLDRSAEVFQEHHVEVFAWSLMDNHLHLAAEATGGSLSPAMQRVLGPYAQWHNRRHGRVGPLFRDRFLSRPVEDDDDLVGLIAYVLLNPLESGVVPCVSELCSYPWTALAELVPGYEGSPVLVSRARVLSLFGASEQSGFNELVSILNERHELRVSGEGRGGGTPFAPVVVSPRDRHDLQLAHVRSLRLRDDRIHAAMEDRQARALRRLRLRNGGWTLERCVIRASRLCGADPERVRRGYRGRAESEARMKAAYFGRSCLGVSFSDLGRAMGVSRQAIAAAWERAAGRYGVGASDWRGFFEMDHGADTSPVSVVVLD